MVTSDPMLSRGRNEARFWGEISTVNSFIILNSDCSLKSDFHCQLFYMKFWSSTVFLCQILILNCFVMSNSTVNWFVSLFFWYRNVFCCLISTISCFWTANLDWQLIFEVKFKLNSFMISTSCEISIVNIFFCENSKIPTNCKLM